MFVWQKDPALFTTVAAKFRAVRVVVLKSGLVVLTKEGHAYVLRKAETQRLVVEGDATTVAACPDTGHVWIGTREATVQCFAEETGECLLTFRAPCKFQAMTVTSVGSVLFASGSSVYSTNSDKPLFTANARIVDLKHAELVYVLTKNRVQAFDLDMGTERHSFSLPGEACSMAVTGDGHLLVGGPQGIVKVLTTAGELKYSWNTWDSPMYTSCVCSLAVLPDNSVAAVTVSSELDTHSVNIYA